MSTSLQITNAAELRYDRSLSGTRQSTVMSIGEARSILPSLGDTLKVWTGSFRTAGGLDNSGATLDLSLGEVTLDGEVITPAEAAYDGEPYFRITALDTGFAGNNIQFALDDALLGSSGWSPNRSHRITVSLASDEVTTLIRYNPATNSGTLAYEHCSSDGDIAATVTAELTLSVISDRGERTSTYEFEVVEDETPDEWVSHMVTAINAATSSYFTALFIAPNEFKVFMRNPETTATGIDITLSGGPAIVFEVPQATNLGASPAPTDTWGDVVSRINAHAEASALVTVSTLSSGAVVDTTYTGCRLSGGVGVAVVNSTPFFASGESIAAEIMSASYKVLGYSLSVTPNHGSGVYTSAVTLEEAAAVSTLSVAKGGLRYDNAELYEGQAIHYLHHSGVDLGNLVIGDAIGSSTAQAAFDLSYVAVSGNFLAGDSITVDGNTLTFVAGGSAGVGEVDLGLDIYESLMNLTQAVEGLALGVHLVTSMSAYPFLAPELLAVADTPGDAGNSFVIASYFYAGGGHSGLPLSGGADYATLPPTELDVTLTWAVYYAPA